jgi:hypothetical protein
MVDAFLGSAPCEVAKSADERTGKQESDCSSCRLFTPRILANAEVNTSAALTVVGFSDWRMDLCRRIKADCSAGSQQAFTISTIAG